MPGVATSRMCTHTLRLEQQGKGMLGALRRATSPASDALCIWVLMFEFQREALPWLVLLTVDYRPLT